MSRRRGAVLLALAYGIFVLAGCSPGQSAETSSLLSPSLPASSTEQEASSQIPPQPSQDSPSSQTAASSSSNRRHTSSAPPARQETSSSGTSSQTGAPISVTPVKTTYGRSLLNQREKQLYDQLLQAILAMEKQVKISSPIPLEQAQKVIRYLRLDHVELFWAPMSYTWNRQWDGSVVSVILNYVKNDKDGNLLREEYQREEILAMQAQVEQAAQPFLKGIDASMSDFDKVKLIHDRLANAISYELTPNSYGLYGALVEGKAVCEGYSEALSYLLQQVGVDTITVTGTAIDGVRHQWNLVKMDGDYYHLDLTYDDPAMTNKPEGYVSYEYFGLTTQEITQTHTLDNELYPLPGCTATQNNYFVKKGLFFPDYTQASKEAIGKEAARAYLAGESFFQVRFASQRAYQEAYDDLITSQQIFALVRQAAGGMGPRGYQPYQGGDFSVLQIGFIQ